MDLLLLLAYWCSIVVAHVGLGFFLVVTEAYTVTYDTETEGMQGYCLVHVTVLHSYGGVPALIVFGLNLPMSAMINKIAGINKAS